MSSIDSGTDGCILAVVDDLMSLLDAGMHADHPGVIIDSDTMFAENMFGYSALRGRAAMRSRVGMFTDVFGACVDSLGYSLK